MNGHCKVRFLAVAGPCRVRERDEFQELCGLINEAVAVLRQGGQEPEVFPEVPPAMPGEPTGERETAYRKSA